MSKPSTRMVSSPGLDNHLKPCRRTSRSRSASKPVISSSWRQMFHAKASVSDQRRPIEPTPTSLSYPQLTLKMWKQLKIISLAASSCLKTRQAGWTQLLIPTIEARCQRALLPCRLSSLVSMVWRHWVLNTSRERLSHRSRRKIKSRCKSFAPWKSLRVILRLSGRKSRADCHCKTLLSIHRLSCRLGALSRAQQDRQPNDAVAQSPLLLRTLSRARMLQPSMSTKSTCHKFWLSNQGPWSVNSHSAPVRPW